MTCVGIEQVAQEADRSLRTQIGELAARGDPFQLGTSLGNSDATPHAFGLYITDALYRRYGGSAT